MITSSHRADVAASRDSGLPRQGTTLTFLAMQGSSSARAIGCAAARERQLVSSSIAVPAIAASGSDKATMHLGKIYRGLGIEDLNMRRIPVTASCSITMAVASANATRHRVPGGARVVVADR
jgi:hypothetical protein